jgi:hypothetical protein
MEEEKEFYTEFMEYTEGTVRRTRNRLPATMRPLDDR